MSAAGAFGAAVLSAALFALAFPPFGLRPLAFVCLVPLLLALRSGGTGRALAVAWLWAVLAAWAIAPSFPGSIARYAQRPAWVGWAAGTLLFTAMAAVYYMAFAPVHRLLGRRPHAATPLLVAAAWATAELGRGRLFTGTPFFIGNPWGLMGYTHASGPLAQIASATGVYGIGFVLVAVNAGGAELLAAWRRGPRRRRVALRGAAWALLPALAAAGAGAAVLARAPDRLPGAGSVEVAVVQGDVSVERTWRSEYYGRHLDVYLRLTREALRRGEPRSVVWPEGSLNFFLEVEPSYLATIAAVLREGDVELLAGGPSADGDRSPPYYNSVFLVSPAGALRGRYDKQYLVPFSEYSPLASADLVRRAFEGARRFSHGGPARLLDTRFGRAGILVCNEAMLPEVAGARVGEGAEVLVSPSNDGWIEGRGFAEHMFAVVALRAIEQRRFLIRASTSGPSAVVDPWGRVTARTEPFSRAVLRGRVEPRRARSAYGRLGDVFGGTCALVTAGWLAWTLFAPRGAAIARPKRRSGFTSLR